MIQALRVFREPSCITLGAVEEKGSENSTKERLNQMGSLKRP